MKNKGVLCALLGGAIWGFSGTCGQYIFSFTNMNALTLTWFRLLVAGIVLTILSLIKYPEQVKKILSNKKDCLHCVLFATVGLLICQWSYLEAIQYSNSATATVFQYSGILFIMILTCLIKKRLPLIKEVIALGLVLLGVFFVATHGQTDGLVISDMALFWGFVTCMAMCSYSMLPGHLLSTYGASNVLGWSMLIDGILTTFMVKPWTLSLSIDFKLVVLVGFIVIFGTMIAFTLYMFGISYIGAMRASMIACVEPVVATITSFFWLHTSFTGLDLFGFICIVLGVLMINYQKEPVLQNE